jgi:phosphomannomutase
VSDIYLFDVDGTLTPPKSRIDAKFKSVFKQWSTGREVYIVSGGSFLRLIDQLGLDTVEQMSGIFPCMGNAFYQKRDQINEGGYSEWDAIYENKFISPKNLKRSLNSIVAKSDYPTKTGNHHEDRIGMINFSVVGRNADKTERARYEQWDAETNERKGIVQKLKGIYPGLDFVIGGAVSIDISNKGNDKSQVIGNYFKEALEHNQIHFVGDRIPFPGNDHYLARALTLHSNGAAYEVERWQDTVELLKSQPFA